MEETTIGYEYPPDSQTPVPSENTTVRNGTIIYNDIVGGNDLKTGHNTVLMNDPAPTRTEGNLRGPTLEDHVSVGANATILPGLTVGRCSFVAAGAIVTRNVPEECLGSVRQPRTNRFPTNCGGENRLE